VGEGEGEGEGEGGDMGALSPTMTVSTHFGIEGAMPGWAGRRQLPWRKKLARAGAFVPS
jgi:hypothetical protein